jgi:hypothetical protein
MGKFAQHDRRGARVRHNIGEATRLIRVEPQETIGSPSGRGERLRRVQAETGQLGNLPWQGADDVDPRHRDGEPDGLRVLRVMPLLRISYHVDRSDAPARSELR